MRERPRVFSAGLAHKGLRAVGLLVLPHAIQGRDPEITWLGLPPGTLHRPHHTFRRLLVVAGGFVRGPLLETDGAVDGRTGHTRSLGSLVVVKETVTALARLEVVAPIEPVHLLIQRGCGRIARQGRDIHIPARHQLLVVPRVLVETGEAVIAKPELPENLVAIEIEFVGQRGPLRGVLSRLAGSTRGASTRAGFNVGHADIGIGCPVGQHLVGIDIHRGSALTQVPVENVILVELVPGQLEVQITGEVLLDKDGSAAVDEIVGVEAAKRRRPQIDDGIVPCERNIVHAPAVGSEDKSAAGIPGRHHFAPQRPAPHVAPVHDRQVRAVDEREVRASADILQAGADRGGELSLGRGTAGHSFAGDEIDGRFSGFHPGGVSVRDQVVRRKVTVVDTPLSVDGDRGAGKRLERDGTIQRIAPIERGLLVRVLI